MEKSRDYIELYICFIDYQKAFDSVDHKGKWSKQVVHTIIKELYKDCKAFVALDKNGKMGSKAEVSITSSFKLCLK